MKSMQKKALYLCRKRRFEKAFCHQTEGSFYKPNSHERTSLREPGISGTLPTVTGYVLSTTCQPIAHALYREPPPRPEGTRKGMPLLYDEEGIRVACIVEVEFSLAYSHAILPKNLLK